jgi:hypothetical protein
MVYPPRDGPLSTYPYFSLTRSSAPGAINLQTSDSFLSPVRSASNVDSDAPRSSQQLGVEESASSTASETIASPRPIEPLEGYEQAYLMRVFAEQWGPGVSSIAAHPLMCTG